MICKFVFFPCNSRTVSFSPQACIQEHPNSGGGSTSRLLAFCFQNWGSDPSVQWEASSSELIKQLGHSAEIVSSLVCQTLVLCRLLTFSVLKSYSSPFLYILGPQYKVHCWFITLAWLWTLVIAQIQITAGAFPTPVIWCICLVMIGTGNSFSSPDNIWPN